MIPYLSSSAVLVAVTLSYWPEQHTLHAPVPPVRREAHPPWKPSLVRGSAATPRLLFSSVPNSVNVGA